MSYILAQHTAFSRGKYPCDIRLCQEINYTYHSKDKMLVESIFAHNGGAGGF
jgi:hypothetical protein